MKKDDVQIVGEIRDALPAVDRRIIELAYYSVYRRSQIAEKLVIPLGAVKSDLRRGVREQPRNKRYLSSS